MPRGETEIPPFSLHAWVDESISVTNIYGPSGYVLAAVVADPLQCDGLRDKLRGLVPSRQDRLHWRTERSPQRDRICQTVADGDLVAIVVVGAPVRPSLQERARSRCLERLLLDMYSLGVSQVCLESRQEILNRNDLRTIEDLRGPMLIPRELQVRFRGPLDDPMLWLPDAVAGAVAASRRGESRWMRILGSTVTVVYVRVT